MAHRFSINRHRGLFFCVPALRVLPVRLRFRVRSFRNLRWEALPMRHLALLCLLAFAIPTLAQPAAKKSDGNRLAYLDELDPYYPHAKFPKLTTPQWVGEKDVEAVVVLAIDD